MRAVGSDRRLEHRVRIRSPRPASSRADPARVSVVIPCFNYESFLPEAVRSALQQHGVRVDVIVVDDASTDGSLEVARSLADSDPRITVLSHRRNQGPVATYNDGLAEATGEFSVRLDADDLLTPGALARAVAVFDAFPSVGLVYGHPIHFTTQPPDRIRSTVRSWSVWPGTAWLERRCRLGVNCITSPEVVMRQEVVDRVGGQRELEHTHDMEMWMRIATVSDIGHIDGADQALHRDHPRSRTANMVELLDLSERRAAFECLFEGQAGRLAEADRLQDLARQALAAEALRRACHAFDRGRVDREPVAEFRSFAIATYDGARELPEWFALQRRERVGARLAPMMPTFAAAVVGRRIGRELSYRHWTRTGV